MEVDNMNEYEREMEIIALLSNIDDNYTYVNCDKDVVEHSCEKTNEQRQIKLIEVEYFKDAGLKVDKANFCDECKQVFVYKP
ncbi:MAG TPA: hypothetical protein ENH30_00235 [Nitrospirae bacterium]|nr:hypothetical protein [Nitrospirota bacterium]